MTLQGREGKEVAISKTLPSAWHLFWVQVEENFGPDWPLITLAFHFWL